MTTPTAYTDDLRPAPAVVLADTLRVLGTADAMHTTDILAALKRLNHPLYRDHDAVRLALDLKAAGATRSRQICLNRVNRNGYRREDLQPTPAGTDLATFAATLNEQLRHHFDPATLPQQQVLCLAEETGEFIAAYRRWAGLARRNGPWTDVTAELADVVIAAYAAADVLGIDLDTAWQTKARIVLTRGFRTHTPAA